MSRTGATHPSRPPAKLAAAPHPDTPWRGRTAEVPCGHRGEPFAFVHANPTGAHVSEELATEVRTSTRTDSERRGITIGILVVVLLCLSLFFVWRSYGVPGSADQPAAVTPR